MTDALNRTWRAVRGLVPALAIALGGCAVPSSTVDKVEAAPEIIQSAVQFQKEYLLFPGDQVEVVVWRVPEVSRTVIVRPDGMISLPLVQDVKAAGVSARELAGTVKALLTGRLLNPEVAVIPLQVRQPMVYVLGDVKTPSAVPLRDAPTVLAAIGRAGGFQRSGAEGSVTLIRLSRDGYLRAIPVKPVSMGGQPDPYLSFGVAQLEPDDVVFVPEHGRSQVVRFLDDIVMRPATLFINYRLYQKI